MDVALSLFTKHCIGCSRGPGCAKYEVEHQGTQTLHLTRQTCHELMISEAIGEGGRYLFEGYGEGDPAALLERLHHLLADLAPRTANVRTQHDLATRRPRRLAGLHPLYHIQQQFRRQVRPPPLMLLLLRPLLAVAVALRLRLLRPQARPRMPRPRAAMAGAPVGGTGAPRHAPDAVPHLL